MKTFFAEGNKFQRKDSESFSKKIVKFTSPKILGHIGMRMSSSYIL